MAQDLDVAQLADPEGREGVEHGRDRRGAGLAREVPHQPEHREAGQREGGEPDEIVGEEDAGTREAREADERHEPQEMLRVGERPAVRVEHVGVEEPEGRRP